MRWLALLTAFALLTAPSVATQSTTADQAAPSVLATGISVPTVAVDTPKSFDEWLVDLRTEARGKGFSDGLIEETLAGLTPLERVIQSDRSQAELNPGFSRYSNARITKSMVTRGRDIMAEHKDLLHRTELEFGIPARVLVAFWGMESR